MIISNLKQFKGLGRILGMSINPIREEKKRDYVGNANDKVVRRQYDNKENLGKNMFSWLNAEVDSDVEESCLVVLW